MTDITVQVNAVTDDARSYSDGWSFSTWSTTHYIWKIRVWWSQRDFWVWNRFTGVTIPQWATIVSAMLDMYNATAWEWTTVEMKIVWNDVDDAVTYSTSNKPSDNVDTTASLSVSVDVATFQTAQGFWNILRDIKDIIQEIVNRAWWVSGKSIAIVCRDDWSADDSNISVSTEDRAAWRWMTLDITYTVWWVTRRIFVS